MKAITLESQLCRRCGIDMLNITLHREACMRTVNGTTFIIWDPDWLEYDCPICGNWERAPFSDSETTADAAACQVHGITLKGGAQE